MEDWVTIKTLKARNPDMSYREIGRLLNISQNTVKRALNNDNPPEYKRTERVNSQLEPFKEVIFEMLNVKRLKGSRILEEVKSKGYKGGKTAFYDYLVRVKIDLKKDFTPYETAAGVQAQFDWSPYTVMISGELTKIYIYLYLNSFSRYHNFEASLSENQGAVFEALERSIIESKGVPSRIQTDNAKVFVSNASRNNFQWNKKYLHFCGHYGFQPSRSLPAHPWSKGKVEKPFSYLENHFITGNSFEDFEDLCVKLKEFQKKVNMRIHSTTKAAPEKLMFEERRYLSSLPETRYIGVKEEIRKVSFDCLISFNGSRYSVPWMFAGKQVWVKVSKGYYLEVYSQSNKLIAKHKLSLKKRSIVIEQSHYRGNKSYTGNFQRLKNEFLESFPGKELFIEKLKAQKRINANSHLRHILEISKMYHKDDFLKAIGKSLEYNVFNSAFISGYLEKNFKQKFEIKQISLNLFKDKEFNNLDIKRNLNEYQITI